MRGFLWRTRVENLVLFKEKERAFIFSHIIGFTPICFQRRCATSFTFVFIRQTRSDTRDLSSRREHGVTKYEPRPLSNFRGIVMGMVCAIWQRNFNSRQLKEPRLFWVEARLEARAIVAPLGYTPALNRAKTFVLEAWLLPASVRFVDDGTPDGMGFFFASP